MKIKFLSIFLSLFLFTSSCSAQIVTEWESDNAVSYTAINDKGGSTVQISIVNYTTSDNTNEYWLRLASGRHKNKIMHWMILYIDDKEYELVALKNPDEKFALAGSSEFSYIISDGHPNPGVVIPRYFLLSDEIIENLSKAKSIKVRCHLQTVDNKVIEYSDGKIKEVKDVITRKFSDREKFLKLKR